MNAINYDKQMQEIVAGLGGRKPSLLLHACCAPCSSACLERLKDAFAVTVFFYNPNIDGGEYERRKNELLRLVGLTGWADVRDCGHEADRFARAAEGLENAPEGGARCERCFSLRLRRTAEEAARGGFEFFGTTLTLSPLKNARLINAVGERAAAEYNVRWLPSDFKKRDGYLRSLQLSEQYGLYRQDYCGCAYSQRQREEGCAQ